MHARKLCAAVILMLVPSSAFAWGAKGHAVTAALAERHLSAPAAAEVRTLLFGQTLASIASEPDDWRAAEDRDPSLPKTGPFHYVNIPNDIPTYDAARDCKEGNCVVGAIDKFSAVLRDRCKPAHERKQALIFLTHFVGDIHQPLHAAQGTVRTSDGKIEPDLGGNRVPVTYLGASSNLHKAWDEQIIEGGPETVDEYVDYLLRYELRGRSLDELRGGTASDWANESHHAAVSSAYDIGSGRLGSDYAHRNVPVVYERLMRGGLRLAKLLDDVLAPTLKKADCPPEPKAVKP